MADLIDPKTLEVGQYVSFSCKHPTDQTTYEGKIVGIMSYDIAKNVEPDLIPYYREVAKVIKTLEPYSTLKYLCLEYNQGGNIALKLVRAIEWIDPATVKILDPDAHVTVKIYNVLKERDGDKILSLLGENGYLCSIVENE